MEGPLVGGQASGGNSLTERPQFSMAANHHSFGLIQCYRRKLQVCHYAHRTVNTYEQGRDHSDSSLVHKVIRRAMIVARINKTATTYSLRHSCATQPMGQDQHIRRIH